MTTTINYLQDPIPQDQEADALQNLCQYLVAKGKYKNLDAALSDADKRVTFLEDADVYSDDPQMATASKDLKLTHALIAGHKLHDILSENDGYLPQLEEAKVARKGSSRSITDVFGSIALDIKVGMSREQIIAKLVGDGLATENAEEAYQFVMRQQAQKKQARLTSVIAILVLGLVLFGLSFFWFR